MCLFHWYPGTLTGEVWCAHHEVASAVSCGACRQAQMCRQSDGLRASIRWRMAHLPTISQQVGHLWMAASVSEFDPGSGTTLAACLTHASRAGSPFGAVQRRTGEERVIDLPARGGQPRETGAVTACVRPPVGGSGKAFRGARGGGCVRLASRRGDGPPRRRSVAGLRGRPATGGLRHGPHTYGWQQRGIFGNGRKPDRATPRAG